MKKRDGERLQNNETRELWLDISETNSPEDIDENEEQKDVEEDEQDEDDERG